MKRRRLFFVVLVVASTPIYAQGDRTFCNSRKDGWYTHPTCHYLYKCQNSYTYEVPVKPGIIIGSSCVLPSEGEAADNGFCASAIPGLYPTAECRTYTLCENGKASKHTVPKDTFVCDL